jgi:peptidoglycan hydrolase-like protein with peptidoglycan-binding domain
VTARRRVGRWATTGTVVVAVGVAATAATGFDLTAKHSSTARTGGTLPAATAKVTRQTLVDTRSVDGTLGHGDAVTVNNRLAGTLTSLAAVDSTVGRGKPLYRVDTAPVILLYGTLPAYRPLFDGVSGPDVRQFEKNLWALGYHGFTVDDDYTSATAAAVKKWQLKLGLAETGTVELGRVVYSPAAVRVNELKAAVGDVAAPGQPILTWTARERLATTQLDVSDEALARTGTKAKVDLPDGTTAAGTVHSSHAVVIPASGNDPATTKIQATVAIPDQKALAQFDQASVTVDFVASQRKNVLSVPVAALLALAGGGYGVQVVENGTTRIIPVETGLFADTLVEVSGTGLTAGMSVGVPS